MSIRLFGSRRAPSAMGLVVVLTCQAVLAAVAAAAELDRKQLVDFLDLGWRSHASDTTELDEQFEQLRDASNRDPRLLHALAIIKIKLRQYPDAARLVDELLESDAKNLHLHRTKIWLTVSQRQFGQTLVALEKAAAPMPPEPTKDGDDDDVALEHARYLGRIFGYLEGPAADEVSQDKTTTLRRKLAMKMSETRRTALTEGRDSLIDRYLSLIDEKEAGREKARQASDVERENRLADLDRQADQDEKRAAELDSRRDRLRAELDDQSKEWRKQDSPLLDQVGRLDAQAAAVRRDLALVTNDLSRWQTLAARERDPVIRAGYLAEIARLDAIATQYDGDLAGLNRRAAGIQAQRADLQRRQNQAQASTNRQLEAVTREQTDLVKQAKRRDLEQKKLRRAPPKVDTPHTLAKAAVAASFSTYEPFPLDGERQWLLDQVRN